MKTMVCTVEQLKNYGRQISMVGCKKCLAFVNVADHILGTFEHLMKFQRRGLSNASDIPMLSSCLRRHFVGF
jgi:hypothetical protein